MAPNKSVPDIDVLLVTYNHEKYIRQALESIAYQVYGARVRVIVADDSSTDRTIDIIADFAKSNEGIDFVFLPSTGNVGITANYARGFAAIRADYVAVLEGDDFWSSTHKLLKQVEFLEEHRECAACACNYHVYDEHRKSSYLRVNSATGYLFLTPQTLIRDNLIGNFSTCVYRRHILESLPQKLFAIKAYDWAVNICVAMRGIIGFLQEPLSVYRQHGASTWSSMEVSQKLRAQLDIIPVYDELTDGVFSKDFEELHRALIAHPELQSPRRRYLLRRLAHVTPVFIRRSLRGYMPERIVSFLN